MALAGAHRLFGEGAHSVEDLRLHEALQLDFHTPNSIQVIFQTKDAQSAAFEMFSAPGDEQDADALWTRNALGRVAKATNPRLRDKSADLQDRP